MKNKRSEFCFLCAFLFACCTAKHLILRFDGRRALYKCKKALVVDCPTYLTMMHFCISLCHNENERGNFQLWSYSLFSACGHRQTCTKSQLKGLRSRIYHLPSNCHTSLAQIIFGKRPVFSVEACLHNLSTVCVLHIHLCIVFWPIVLWAFQTLFKELAAFFFVATYS